MAQICPTSRPEKLLLPTDGSEFSEGAIREAISLAKSCSSKLIVVSVIETNPEYETLAPQLVEKAELNKEKYTNEYVVIVNKKLVAAGCDIVAMLKSARKKYPGSTPFIAKIPDKSVLVL